MGAPPHLAERIVSFAKLATALDIVKISEEMQHDMRQVAEQYFGVGLTTGLDLLRRKARAVPARTEWQRFAANDLIDETHAQQRDLVRRAAASDSPRDFIRTSASLVDLLAEVKRTEPPDFALLAVASRRIKSVTASGLDARS